MESTVDIEQMLPMVGAFVGGFFFIIVAIIIWCLIWKGMALWKAARNGHKGWFIALLVLNTMGVLPILYLLLFSKPKATGEKQEEAKEASKK